MEQRFAEIAREYDRMFLRDLEADRVMLVTLMERYGARTVLDCACGTGVHTGILAREGYSVVGSDASAEMLEVARSKHIAAGLEVALYKSTWRDLSEVVPGTFDAVICMGNSLPLEPDDDAVVESLSGMYAMLNEGGVLLVSSTSADRQLAEKTGLEVVETEPDCFVLLACDFGTDKTTHKYFFIDSAGDEPAMRYYRFELLNLTGSKMESLAREAGIDKVTLYGDKDFTPYSALESERAIFVVEKSAASIGM